MVFLRTYYSNLPHYFFSTEAVEADLGIVGDLTNVELAFLIHKLEVALGKLGEVDSAAKRYIVFVLERIDNAIHHGSKIGLAGLLGFVEMALMSSTPIFMASFRTPGVLTSWRSRSTPF